MKYKEKGFTLVELLVVISIIALLSSIVLASVNTARSRSRDAQRRLAIRQIQTALELYYHQNGSYPISGGATSPNGSWSTSNDSSWITLQTALAPYIISLPTDPKQDSSGSPVVSGASYAMAYSYFSIAYKGCPAGSYYLLAYRTEVAPSSSYNLTMCDGTTFGYNPGNGFPTTVTVGPSPR